MKFGNVVVNVKKAGSAIDGFCKELFVFGKRKNLDPKSLVNLEYVIKRSLVDVGGLSDGNICQSEVF